VPKPASVEKDAIGGHINMLGIAHAISPAYSK